MRTLHVVAPAGLVGGGLTALGGNVAHVLMREADASLTRHRARMCVHAEARISIQGVSTHMRDSGIPVSSLRAIVETRFGDLKRESRGRYLGRCWRGP